jgi:hypothetical protein
MAGDLNINILAAPFDNNAKKLTEIMNTYDMYLVNNEGVSRAADNPQGGSLIDHIFSNKTQSNTFQIINNILSDHKAVSASINLPVQRIKDSFQMIRKFTVENWEMFMKKLTQENWQEVYDHPDLDYKSEIFMAYRNCLTNNSQLQLHVKPITLNISSQNPLHMAARIFNKLLTAPKEIDDDLIFVRKLKQMLHQTMF